MDLTLQEKRKLINFFEFLLDEEISKPLGEMNDQAVDNYIKILLYLQDKQADLSPEFIDEQVRKIFRKDDSAVPETAKTTKKQYSKNKIWLVAACIAILVALFSIVSFGSEKSVVDTLEDFFGTFEFIPFDKKVEVGNETYGKGNESRHYESIDEFIKNEKFNLLYPKSISDNIDYITITETNEKGTITFTFSNGKSFITVALNAEIPQKTIDCCNSKITLNEIEYYICTIEDISKIQAYFVYNRNFYTVMTETEEDLMNIINNMEEINYED